ncbi:MAG: hypothetical protein JNK85_08555 [Verrucomicrobiales bacterium]|nr:hypothetical protein [Verrucomicrobiales bacterium]
MNRHLFVVLWMISGAQVGAQGVVNFSTRAGATVNAPVTYLGDNTLADGRFLGQLYAGALNGPLSAVGSPTPFRSDAGKGYITAGGNVEVPGVLPGETARVKLVAWAGSLGDTYLEALGRNVCGVGESPVITIQLGGGTLPPAALAGLSGFVISLGCPEPSPLAIGLIGAGLLWTCRRQGKRSAR